LSLERLFQLDYDDGSLELLATLPVPLEGLVLGKALAHWISTALPLIILAPVLAITLNLPPSALGALVISLLLGTPALSLLGAVGAALTIGVRRGGVLVPLLVLPLLIPTLIFGVGASAAGLAQMTSEAPLLLLSALSLLSLVIAPVAGAAALKLVLE
jgi:heme exporter protein B